LSFDQVAKRMTPHDQPGAEDALPPHLLEEHAEAAVRPELRPEAELVRGAAADLI
jgi:hypothetical protein